MSSMVSGIAQREKSYGIRIKNPLPKPVRVEVIDGKTIVHQTVIRPGATKFCSLDKLGEYDVRTTILDGDPQDYEELGSADWAVVDHQDVREEPKMKPVLLQKTLDLVQRFWRDVVIWKVTPGSTGELLAVEIKPTDDVEWRLKAMLPGDGRFGGKILGLTNSMTFSDYKVTGGQIIKVQAKSISGSKVTASARISGRETVHRGDDDEPRPVGITIRPVSPTKETPKGQETPVQPRSLADMIAEMESQEVAVK